MEKYCVDGVYKPIQSTSWPQRIVTFEEDSNIGAVKLEAIAQR